MLKRKVHPYPTEDGWYYAQKKASLGFDGCVIQPTRVLGPFIRNGVDHMVVVEWGGLTEWTTDQYDWYGPVEGCEAVPCR